VCLALSILAARQEVVWPTWNMVINVGFESGTHGGAAPTWEPQWERPPPAPLRLPPFDGTPSEPRRALLDMLREHMAMRDAEARLAPHTRLRRLFERRRLAS
jgi:hypothetical protein